MEGFQNLSSVATEFLNEVQEKEEQDLASLVTMTNSDFEEHAALVEDEEGVSTSDASTKQSSLPPFKQLLSDTVSPVSDKSSVSLTDDFLNFCPTDLAKPGEVDFFKRSGN
ncbi:hypothetical protein OUZ56_029542 [Daphnia magna]|uniref:Uncharacterized protein n=1 Tax=Daphnia magna TaxID=35525 RepID=A0ABR0B743_9CRUS|nr:hypothetical protein OUZ56_029542 [Daphnia magna]